MERVVAIWMILLLAVAVVTALLAVPRKPGAGRRGIELAPVPESPADLFRTDDDLRYADEVAVAAERAAATVRRRRDDWTTAQDAVDAAWTAYDEADRAAQRAARAAAYPVMRRRRAPGENADRERYLHRTALAACRHRQISIGQLNEVLAHRGWNPRLHPAAQESALRLAVRDHRYAAYRTAVEHERQAWDAAEQAAIALASLRAEARAATVRVSVDNRAADADWWAEQWATAEPARTVAA